MLKNSKNTVERRSLGFSKDARELFSFLEVKWVFNCVLKDMKFVRYESADVYVNVYHGRYSFEIGV